MPAPLPLPLRALMVAATYAIQRGWLPAPVAVLDSPHGERLARKAMRIACKPGDEGRRPRRNDEMPHGFLMFSRLTKRADESMDEMARETTKVLTSALTPSR